MQKKKAVIFDFDGTLADSLAVLIESYNAIAPRYRMNPVDVTDLPELRKMTYSQLFKRANIRKFMLPLIIRAGTKELKKRRRKVVLYPGIASMLQQLVDSGYQVGILTSNDSTVVEKILSEHQVAGLNFIVSERSLFAKHKAFKKIEKQHNLEARDILYVGDESRDVSACRKAGVTVVGVTWGLGGNEAFERTPADAVVSSVPELRNTIETYLA